MRTKLRTYFIGEFLKNTDDVFEKARAIMLYQFVLVFQVIFLMPFITDILLGYTKGAILHAIDILLLLYFLVLLKKAKNLDSLINLFFALCFFSSLLAFMVFNPVRIDSIGVSWTFAFLTLSALLQRGLSRILYCCFWGWVPIAYAFINIQLDGALTWKLLKQDGTEDPPIFLILIPIILSIYAIWTHTGTIRKAKEQIMLQKQMIETKNKDITDSIVYAQRIQQSLLPTEKYIDKNIERLKSK